MALCFKGDNGEQPVTIKQLKSPVVASSEVSSQPPLAFEEIDKILNFNQCECWSLENMLRFFKTGRTEDTSALRLNALWLVLSYMNHACDCNTTRFTIGDVVFIVAIRDIKQGEEVTMLY